MKKLTTLLLLCAGLGVAQPGFAFNYMCCYLSGTTPITPIDGSTGATEPCAWAGYMSDQLISVDSSNFPCGNFADAPLINTVFVIPSTSAQGSVSIEQLPVTSGGICFGTGQNSALWGYQNLNDANAGAQREVLSVSNCYHIVPSSDFQLINDESFGGATIVSAPQNNSTNMISVPCQPGEFYNNLGTCPSSQEFDGIDSTYWETCYVTSSPRRVQLWPNWQTDFGTPTMPSVPAHNFLASGVQRMSTLAPLVIGTAGVHESYTCTQTSYNYFSPKITFQSAVGSPSRSAAVSVANWIPGMISPPPAPAPIPGLALMPLGVFLGLVGWVLCGNRSRRPPGRFAGKTRIPIPR